MGFDYGFNPHPAWKPGATRPPPPPSSLRKCFNPHPAWKPGATQSQGATQSTAQVSILTRHGSRVQRFPTAGCTHMRPVSILTRHGSRVQPFRGPHWALATRFQSSPGMEAGCNKQFLAHKIEKNLVSILTRHGSRVQHSRTGKPAKTTISFNPHPAWKPGATLNGLRLVAGKISFQSSPGMEAGCNNCFRWPTVQICCFNPHPAWKPGATAALDSRSALGLVSILTRHGSRVQLDRIADRNIEKLFQSSPGMEAGCNIIIINIVIPRF
ncbi:MAG: hypothetical protein PWR22_1864 [Moorella sp. (in: firmicutes)]|nr:hypothetical protein [Moorella sp. (in: firmicutes)]